jgi:ligand-binding sensor domain-containing protein/signal transduction histidine kinase
MSILRLSAIFAAFQLFTLPAAAQHKGFFRQVWLEEGLSQSSVTAITQDREGFIWFGTQDGLNRYDGKIVDQYNYQPFNSTSLSGDQIQNLCPGKNNKLWILSSLGLDVMDLKSGINRHISDEREFAGKTKQYVPYRLWVFDDLIYCYGGPGFERIISKNGKFFREPINAPQVKDRLNVLSICKTAKGIFAGTNQGIFFVDTIKNSCFKVEAENIPSFALNMVNAGNKIFFSYKCDIYLLDISTNQVIKHNVGNRTECLVTCALIDNRGTLWVGTTGDGIYNYSYNDNGFTEQKHFIDESGERFSLKCNSITCFFQNKDANDDMLWIGTRDAGAVSYSFARNSFTLYSDLIKDKKENFFGTVKDRKGTIYTGTNNGLFIFTKNESPFYIEIPMENLFGQKPVEAIYCDRNDKVWIGIGRSLCRVENKKLIKVREDVLNNKKTHIMEIAQYTDKELIIGTNTGMFLYNTETDSIYKTPFHIPSLELLSHPVGSIYIDKQSRTWIGTSDGVYCFKGVKQLYHFVNEPEDKNTILSDVIMDINETEAGEILVACTKGLSILVPAGSGFRIENYYKTEGLSNNFLYSILPDKKGKFWFSTNYGICRFDPINRTFRSYHAADGIFINEFNSGGAYAASDGELIFGGLGGLIGFYPEDLPSTKIAPRIVLKSISVNQSPLKADISSTVLTHDKNNIHLEFSVIDFSSDGRTKLLYKLNDDQQWMIVNSTNSITLANLAPGNYKLRVKAMNRDRLETKDTLELNFTIDPPFYQQWWFYSLAILSAGVCGYVIYRNKLRKKIRVIHERERIREEENAKLRKTAALDLHDEFGNGLTRISMLVEMTKLKVAENPDASKLLDTISDNSARLYNGTKDYIWSINSSSDNLYEVIIRIKDFADELFYERGITFNISGLEDDLRNLKQVPGTGRNVAMIFKEALSNIVKHSKATCVELLIERKNGITLKLVDNGIGFNTNTSRNGFGLGNMKQRASRINGEITVQSQQQKGSEISLTLNDYK